MRLSTLPLLLLLVPAVACTDAEDPGDPRDEDVIVDGKSDAFGLVEGSPEANAILDFVNEATDAQLHDEAGLAANAVANILEHRAGPDAVGETADDDAFDTLVELDKVPFVGSQAFTKLLAYVRANGGVAAPATDDPFDPSSCTGAPMTLTEIDQRLGTLGLYQFQQRERDCTYGPNNTRDCEAWKPRPVTDLTWAPAASGYAELAKTSGGDRRIWLYANRSCTGTSRTWSGTSCTGLSGTVTCYTYVDCNDHAYTPFATTTVLDDARIELSGNLTSRCLRLTAHTSHDWVSGLPGVSGPDYTEVDFGVLMRF